MRRDCIPERKRDGEAIANADGRIHKRLIDLNAPTEVVKQIIINIEAGVEVEVTIAA